MKKAFKIIGFSLLVTIIIVIIISSMGVVVSDKKYIDDYNEFYFYQKEYKPLTLLDFGGGGPGPLKKIWFLPGQKTKLLRTMKKDLNTYMTDLVKNSQGVLKGFKFKNDFSSLIIYYNYEVYIYDVSNSIDEEISKQIDAKMELYNEFLYGYFNIEGFSGTHYEAWFEPAKKQETLDKIKNDLVLYLTNFVLENREKLKGYKISDDVKKVYVFYDKNSDRYEVSGPLNLNEIYIANKISLYQECSGGYENGQKYNWRGDVIEWVAK